VHEWEMILTYECCNKNTFLTVSASEGIPMQPWDWREQISLLYSRVTVDLLAGSSKWTFGDSSFTGQMLFLSSSQQCLPALPEW